jgi:hypothetical protein
LVHAIGDEALHRGLQQCLARALTTRFHGVSIH